MFVLHVCSLRRPSQGELKFTRVGGGGGGDNCQTFQYLLTRVCKLTSARRVNDFSEKQPKSQFILCKVTVLVDRKTVFYKCFWE